MLLRLVGALMGLLAQPPQAVTASFVLRHDRSSRILSSPSRPRFTRGPDPDNSVATREGFLDDLFGGGASDSGDSEAKVGNGDGQRRDSEAEDGDSDDDVWSNELFRREIDRRGAKDGRQPPGGQDAAASGGKSVASPQGNAEDDEEVDSEFDGYALRDVIYSKWGQCFDVDFQPVDSFGFRCLYLNVLPFRLGSRRFRHASEYDYLCHLQAVVEILVSYDQLDYVLAQIEETTKKPRPNTSPLVAVPLRLDLSPEQVDKILG